MSEQETIIALLGLMVIGQFVTIWVLASILEQIHFTGGGR